MSRPPPSSTLFPYTTLFRSVPVIVPRTVEAGIRVLGIVNLLVVVGRIPGVPKHRIVRAEDAGCVRGRLRDSVAARLRRALENARIVAVDVDAGPDLHLHQRQLF